MKEKTGIFETKEEFFDNLKQIKRADLSSEETPFPQAYSLCCRVMSALLLSKGLDMTDKDMFELESILKNLGCTNMDNAHEKFLPNRNVAIADTKQKGGSIEFAINTFHVIIGAPKKTARFGLKFYLEDRDYEDGWIKQWIIAQEQYLKNKSLSK